MPVTDKTTRILVGMVIGVVLITLAFVLTNWKVGLVLTGFLLYEGLALVNTYKEDTISEAIWSLSTRPLIPWLFGAATSWSLATKVVENPWLVLVIGFLNAHFFFQSQSIYETIYRRAIPLVMEQVAEEVVEKMDGH